MPGIFQGRSPCGERGLKYCPRGAGRRRQSRSPCGERGLKLPGLRRIPAEQPSLPVRGAWIEMFLEANDFRLLMVAPRAGSVD